MYMCVNRLPPLVVDACGKVKLGISCHCHSRTRTPTDCHLRYVTPLPLSINTHGRTDTPQLSPVLQLSEVEMKFLLVHFIVVPLIIFTVPPPKGMKAEAHYQSCKELYDKYRLQGVFLPTIPPGYYNITTEEGVKEVYCNLTSTDCDGVG